MTIFIVTFLAVGGCGAIFWYSFWTWNLRKLRRRGILKPNARPTMYDVRRLLIEGDRDSAIDVYMLIFKVNRTEAKKQVSELDRHIHQQK